MRLLYLCFFFLFTAFGHPIKNYNPYPKKDFIYPVAGPILLSGTFGELRSNHFHAGIDIKGFVGQPIVAAAQGYVSRIKVESGGYGNVLYLNHPNGYTTVYAHLKKFPKAVEKYIRKIQYQKKQFEVDLFPKAGLFSFEQGAEIGQMGVTGRSFGPHLHFEIRDTKTEEPINPLLFGLLIKDNIPPKMHQLKIYGLNPKRETLTTKTYNLQGKWKVYRAPGDTLTIGAWRIGVGLKVYDHMNGASNWNGIYELTMLVDGQLQYQYRLEKFAFHHTRYINAHLDYAEQVAKKSYINRCYRLPGNKLPIYTQAKENGVVELSKEKAKKIELITTDFDGNESKLVFWVKRGEVSPPKNKSFNYLLPYKEKNVVKDKTAELSFPLGTFYEDLYMQYGVSEEPNESYYSAVYHIHDYTVPVHKYFDIAITPTQIPANQMNKAFIAYCRKGRPPLNCGGEWVNGKLKTKVRDMGDYTIMIDNKAPRVIPIAFSTNMKGYNKMSFKITDNFETARNVKGLSYSAKVDGQWVLMEYDAKSDLIVHRFDGRIGPGSHQLQLIVSDNRGNQTTFERTFSR